MSAKVRDYYAEEVEHLTSFGLHPEATAARIGVSVQTLARALYREQRPDLARPFERLHNQERARGRVCACGNRIGSHRAFRCHPCGIRARGSNRTQVAA